MTQPRAPEDFAAVVLTVGSLMAGLATPLLAQGSDELFAGDSVRVDLPVEGRDVTERFVGRILRIEGREATVISRGPPTCRAGLMHGEGPTCNLGRLIYHTVDLGEISIQRRQIKGNLTKRTILGGLIGSAAFGAVGYAVGPSLGFGTVGGCREGPYCSDSRPGETALDTRLRREAEQRTSDQRRGALFFGVIGGTLGAMAARKLSVGWVDIHPSVPAAPGEEWGLSFRIPAAAR